MSNILDIPPTPDRYKRMIRFLHSIYFLKEMVKVKYPGLNVAIRNSISTQNLVQNNLPEDQRTPELQEMISALEESNKEMLTVSIDIDSTSTKDENKLLQDYRAMHNLLFEIRTLMAEYEGIKLIHRDALLDKDPIEKLTIEDMGFPDSKIIGAAFYKLSVACGFR